MSNFKCLVAALVLWASLPIMASPLAGPINPAAASNPLYAGQSFIFTGGAFFDEDAASSNGSLSRASLVETGNASFDHITFNFYSASTPYTPYAVGTGYLFNQAYTGTPSQLSSARAGLLGTATSDGSLYTFAPTLTLIAGVQYFFYEDAPLQPLSGNSEYTDGVSFASSSPDANFTGPLPSLDFSVTGSPAPITVTPEPSTLALLGTGILALAGSMRKRYVSIHA